jgi:hypothetical protein
MCVVTQCNDAVSYHNYTVLGPTQPPIQCVPEALYLEVKRPGREASHSTPSSAEVKNKWSYTSIPPIRLHGVVLVKQGGNFLSASTIQCQYTEDRDLNLHRREEPQFSHNYTKFHKPFQSSSFAYWRMNEVLLLTTLQHTSSVEISLPALMGIKADRVADRNKVNVSV